MRATRAYITGFGTTGLLIASAFLTLLVMSAYVAFNGFPGQNVEDPIGTLLIPESQTSVKVPPHVLHVRAAKPVRAGRASSAAHTRGSGPRAGTHPVGGPASPQLPASTQGPSSTSQPSPGSTPSSIVPQLPPSTPSLPATPVPLPEVTVPSLPSPPASPAPQVPVDTSPVTGLLGGH